MSFKKAQALKSSLLPFFFFIQFYMKSFQPLSSHNKLPLCSSLPQLNVYCHVCYVSCVCARALHVGVDGSLLLFSFELFFPPSFLLLSYFCLYFRLFILFSPCLCFSLWRGRAVPDGWGPQTDPSAAWGNGWYFRVKVVCGCVF